mmetsp:Transcript_882/g.2468  ORF Transcript_882/g.2468 Transcript_882/m.2468 type:complete len:203 (+) Transcript_882:911-1519(+)
MDIKVGHLGFAIRVDFRTRPAHLVFDRRRLEGMVADAIARHPKRQGMVRRRLGQGGNTAVGILLQPLLVEGVQHLPVDLRRGDVAVGCGHLLQTKVIVVSHHVECRAEFQQFGCGFVVVHCRTAALLDDAGRISGDAIRPGHGVPPTTTLHLPLFIFGRRRQLLPYLGGALRLRPNVARHHEPDRPLVRIIGQCINPNIVPK